MKKSQELPISTIIIAILALAVLVVLILMFTGKLGTVSKGLTEQEKGTTCLDANWKWPHECTEGTIVYANFENAGKHIGKICCMPKEQNGGGRSSVSV